MNDLTPEQKQLIKRYVIGGAAIGGGSALVTTMLRHLNEMSETYEDSDDNTLYIRRKKKDQVKKANWMVPGIALASGVGASVGTYALIQKIFAKIESDRAQAELDEAQNIYIDAKGYEKKANTLEDILAAKSAPMEWGKGVGVALPLLLALGGGVVSYNMLDRSFPVIKKSPTAPRRIEIVEDDDYEEKSASYDDANGLEYMLHSSLASGTASDDVRNVVATAATGGLPAFRNAVETIGFEGALSTIKGASAREVEPINEAIAITYLSRSPLLAPAMGVLAASDFASSYPTFMKAASALPELEKDKLGKVMNTLGYGVRVQNASEVIFSKEASAMIALAGMPINSPEELLATESKEIGDVESELSNEDHADPNSASRKKNKTKIVASSKTGKALLSDIPDDVIDKILASPRRTKLS